MLDKTPTILSEVFAPVFLIRAIIGLVLAGLTTWGVAFWVADYISTVNVNSLSTSVTNLQSSLNTLTTSVDRINSDLLNKDDKQQDALAAKLAGSVKEEIKSYAKRSTIRYNSVILAIKNTRTHLTLVRGSVDELTKVTGILSSRVDDLTVKQIGFRTSLDAFIKMEQPK